MFNRLSNHREDGTALVVFIMLLVVILLICALIMDLGLCYITQTKQTNIANTAKAAKMTPSETLYIKNASNPSLQLATDLIETIRADGYAGDITIYYYEPTETEDGLSDNVRVYAYAVQLDTTYSTLFAKIIGRDTVPVESLVVGSASPYASEKVYRPTSIQNGAYYLAAGQAISGLTFTSKTLSSMPSLLQSELTTRLAAAKTGDCS
jgi:hypothetical protein